MLSTKQKKAGVLGIVLTIIGILFRFFVNFFGSYNNISWILRQVVYKEIGLIFLIFGLAVLLVVIINWLWDQSV